MEYKAFARGCTLSLHAAIQGLITLGATSTASQGQAHPSPTTRLDAKPTTLQRPRSDMWSV